MQVGKTRMLTNYIRAAGCAPKGQGKPCPYTEAYLDNCEIASLGSQ